MTLKAFQQKGYTSSEDEYKALEKLILAQYKEAGELIDSRLEKLFAQMGSGVKPEDQYNWLIQYDRNIKLKNDITSIYTTYDLKAQGLTARSGAVAMSNNYYRQFYSLEWTSPVSFSVLPENMIEYAVTGQIKAWKKLNAAQKLKYSNSSIWPPSGTLTEMFSKNRKDAILAIQRQINAGMISGDSYAKISRRVSKTIGSVSDKAITGQMAKAVRIVRTEGNRLLNEGCYASTLEAYSQGISIMRQWDAAFDSRTRAEHGAADGQEVAVDQPFTVGGEELMNPGDSAGSAENVIHCRCTTVDLVDGFDPGEKKGRDPITGESEDFSFKNFNAWAEGHNLTRNKYGKLYQK